MTATVNSWNDDQKLSFLRVRLPGRAQAVFHRLFDGDKASFSAVVQALKAHFEPNGKQELYLADSSTHSKKKSQRAGEELRWLAAKAYPDLSCDAHEQLALTHFLGSIADSPVMLSVKQKNPKSLAEAVTATMQTECSLASTRIAALH